MILLQTNSHNQPNNMTIDKPLFPYCNADDSTPRTDAAVKLYTTSHADMPSSDFLEFVEGLELELRELQRSIPFSDL